MTIKQSTINITAVVLFSTMAIFLGASVYFTGQALHDNQLAVTKQIEFNQLGIDLAKAANYLTDEARKFIVTGNIEHLQNYWHEVEVVKTRDKIFARLRELGASSGSFDLLETARQSSDNLVKIETRSMRLMLEALEIPESAMPIAVTATMLNPADTALDKYEKMNVAREIMFNKQYEQDRHLINELIDRFQKDINEQAALEVQQATYRTQIAKTALITFAILIPIGMGFIFWGFRAFFSAPVANYIHALQNRRSEDTNFKLIPSGTHELHLLADALNQQIQANRQTQQELQQQNWIKTGQTQLNDQISGEQSLVQLAENIITFLARYLGAQIGAFYIIKKTNQEAILRMIASYAYTWRKEISNEIKLGDGLVGQAALERKPIVVTSVPKEYLSVQSGLGEAPPSAILVLPFLYIGSLKGVIEIASFKPFTSLELEFLKQIATNIGIAINTTESRSRMQELLQQSRTQTEELQAQQEELQQSNEELQTQQEELRHINEELERRSKALEKQKDEIREKNLALEETQKAIKMKAKELELASKYKSEFLANMSHELRTPLNSLLILAQLLAENKTGNLSEKQVEYAQTICSAGSDLLSLINEILDLSKVEAGKVDIHIEAVNLAELLETIQQKFQHVAENKSLNFQITVAEEVPAVLSTDRQRFKQIINNLLSNAFKFTAHGEVKLTIKRVTLDKPELLDLTVKDCLTFSVEDTGIGIPQDKQQVIFEAFQQADGTTSRRYGGTGLGLSISRQLARLLGGEIRVESEEEKGSTFIFYLPEAVATGKTTLTTLESMTEKKKSTETKYTPQQKFVPQPQELSKPLKPLLDDREQLQPDDKFILIVEDDRKFSQILMELAQEKGFKCIVAEDGKAGLQLATEYKPHAVMLDINLPIIDGWAVMEKLKDNPETRHIPVHFISASDQQKDARKMGAIGYLLKPVSMGELGEAFKRIEEFISDALKNLLILVDDLEQEQKIIDLVGGENINATIVKTKESAYQQLTTKKFDCVILDVDAEQGSGITLLESLQKDENLMQSPVIIYAERELKQEEEILLQQCAGNLTIKAVKSPERLLDEAVLFLHQVEDSLTQEKRKMLQLVHNKEVILAHKKVLIVDDDIRNTFALMTFLDGKNMEVSVASNGKEAMTLLEEHPDTDIVLMDIMMPEMDGYEAIRKIRTQPRFRKLPIIALTAKAMKGDKTKCIEAGANDYIAKPVDTSKLISLMRVWLYR